MYCVDVAYTWCRAISSTLPPVIRCHLLPTVLPPSLPHFSLPISAVPLSPLSFLPSPPSPPFSPSPLAAVVGQALGQEPAGASNGASQDALGTPDPAEVSQFFAAALPRLQQWFHWFDSSQKGERGRTGSASWAGFVTVPLIAPLAPLAAL